MVAWLECLNPLCCKWVYIELKENANPGIKFENGDELRMTIENLKILIRENKKDLKKYGFANPGELKNYIDALEDFNKYVEKLETLNPGEKYLSINIKNKLYYGKHRHFCIDFDEYQKIKIDNKTTTCYFNFDKVEDIDDLILTLQKAKTNYINFLLNKDDKTLQEYLKEKGIYKNE
jgi:hypothetical protein